MSWKFWKKDDLGLPELTKSDFSKDPAGLDLSEHFQPSAGFSPAGPGMGAPQFAPSMPANLMPSSFSQAYTPSPVSAPEPSSHVEKELEVIGAKLDTIRAQLEMLNSRLANLERGQEQVQPKRPWY